MRISTKINLTSVGLLVLATAGFLTTLLFQRGALRSDVLEVVREQGLDEANKITQGVYQMCIGTETRNQSRLEHSLKIAREVLTRTGGIRTGTNDVAWSALNQFTRESRNVTLPGLNVGDLWLGQNFDTNQPSPVVDEASHLTRDFCTIFQRMNDEGDMLRVSTSVIGNDGQRAIGTYVPHRLPDGTINPVVERVLRGESYRGRAFVVNQFHASAYEPIWDPGRKEVIGMLYVGIGLGTINKELHDSIIRLVVGKSGYVYVLGGKGDQRGKYIISNGGLRDGESIWEAKDANGRLFIQSIIHKGLQTSNGSLTNEFYPWINPGEPQPRGKFASITYFEPWDWVIGAGAYQEDFESVLTRIDGAIQRLVYGAGIVAMVVGVLGFVVSYFVSAGIVRPVNRVIEDLDAGSDQVTSAVNQLATASQSLADGASQQAASLEETSASLVEMSSMTTRNAENAGKVNDLTAQARAAAERGAGDMQAMAIAVQAIQSSSEDIGKIIKTIDEIAFQTNILALNAAVEAARAGEAGLGFAVVADEVRALAQRSAQAARETSEKIECAIGKSAQGVAISGKVAQSLAGIVSQIRQVNELVAEVAAASREQSQGIAQVNSAVSQMDQVTQSNAASAEESASAAEELNGQAAALRDAVASLIKTVGGRASKETKPPAADTPPSRGAPRVSAPSTLQAGRRSSSIAKPPNQGNFTNGGRRDLAPSATAGNDFWVAKGCRPE